VALKRLKPEWLDADSLARFAGEVQVIGQLEHPGIVPVHDVGLDERGYFFVMKFVEGETLEKVIERLRAGDREALAKYPHEARAQLFLQLCQAMQYAHNKGLIHRDIKPANVMIGPYGEVMLMDWGLAKRVGTRDARLAPGQTATSAYNTMLGHAIGTPMYMPPEQARGEHDRCDARSDVYALCAVFFELMSLQSYLGPQRDVQQILEAVKSKPPPGAAGDAPHVRHPAGVRVDRLAGPAKGARRAASERGPPGPAGAGGAGGPWAGAVPVYGHEAGGGRLVAFHRQARHRGDRARGGRPRLRGGGRREHSGGGASRRHLTAQGVGAGGLPGGDVDRAVQRRARGHRAGDDGVAPAAAVVVMREEGLQSALGAPQRLGRDPAPRAPRRTPAAEERNKSGERMPRRWGLALHTSTWAVQQRGRLRGLRLVRGGRRGDG
jgi:hypothetical protein